MILHELTAETRNSTVSIGNFETLAEAESAAKADENSSNPTTCLYGEIKYFWNETKVL